MEITHKIRMDLTRPGITPRIPVVQGDTYTRRLSIALFSDRRPWRIPSAASVVIRYRKPDCTSGTYDTLPDGTSAVSFSGNTIRILVVPEALSLAGTVSLMVTILLGEQRLSTFSMELDVAPDCVSGWTDEEGAAWIAAFLPAPEYAESGQHFAVDKVDEMGHVLSVKTIDPTQWLENYLSENGIAESVSVYHQWDGTILTVTSASGTSSADLKGEDGYSPTANVEQTEGGAIIHIFDKDGHTFATVDNGKDGKDGQPGKSAYAYAQDGGYTGSEVEFAEKLATELPTMVSQLENDSEYATRSELPKAVCVTLTSLDGAAGVESTYTADKTLAEIIEAHNAGKVVYCYDTNQECSVPMWSVNDTGAVFSGIAGNISLGYIVSPDGADGIAIGFNQTLATTEELPTALPNPNALTINGQTYDGSEAVSITITGGSSDHHLLGQTPLTLTEAATVKLVGAGEHSYTIKGKTVADLSTSTITKSNAEITDHGDYIELRDTGASAWYGSNVTLSVSGLTVGKAYVLAIVGLGLDSTNLINNGYYLIRNSNGTELGRIQQDAAAVHSVEFTPDTSTITIICYPAANYYWGQGHRTARIGDLYINEAADGTERTDIINKSGTFTDSLALGSVSQGVTVTAEPSCEVYLASSSDNAAALPLGGKAVVCFGDSLFGMYTGDTSAPAYVAQRTGATVYNIGFGGCRMAVHPYVGYNEFCMWALAKAVASGDWSAQDAAVSSGSSNFPDQLAILKEIDFSGVDAVVIHYGTNDFTAGAGVAMDNANDPKDYSTLCGALRYSIETLLTAYPHLRIFVSVPAFRYWTAENGTVTYPDAYTNVNGNTLIEFVDAIAATAKEYNLPVIDSYYGLGINKINATAFLADGVHHNETGRKRFGEFIGASIIANF